MSHSTILPNRFGPKNNPVTPRRSVVEPQIEPPQKGPSVFKKFLVGSFVLFGVISAVWALVYWGLGTLREPYLLFWGLGFALSLGFGLIVWGLYVLGQVPPPQRPQPLAPPLAVSEEHHFRRILESIDLVPWEADVWTWKFLYVGPQAELLLGVPQKTWFSGDFWTERIYPPDRDVVIERCRWSCMNRSTVQLEYRMKHANGDLIWVHDLVSAPRSLTGSPIIRGCLMNITERKEAEQALRESDERFRNFFELGQIGMAITTANKGWLQFNEELCQMLGYSRNVLRKKTWADVTHADDLEYEVRMFREVIEGKRDGYDLEKRFLHADGREIHASISVHCVRDAVGQVQYCLTLIQDITHRKQAETAIRQSERRFRELFNNSPDAIFVEDMLGYVLDANPKACQLHDLEREELIGKHVTDLVPARSRGHIFDLSGLKEGEMIQFEADSLSQTNQVVPVEIRVNRMEYEGQTALLLHVRDITPRKEMERKLLQADKMQAIARVAGTASHDFKNKIFAITSVVEMMMANELPTDIRQDVEKIHKAALQANNLIRELLAHDELGGSRVEFVNPAKLLSDNESLIRTMCLSHIECEFTYEVTDQTTLADREKLERVVMNLVKNAIESMAAGGTLSLKLRRVAPEDIFWQIHRDLKHDEFLCLDVTDTGHGMTQEVQSRIFEPFFSTRKEEGTGIGLYSVYTIIKQFDGEVDLRSEPGEGTTFHVYLPVRRPEPDPSDLARLEEHPPTESPSQSDTNAEPSDSTPGESTATILIVDDEPIVRPIFKRLLEAEGFMVYDAESGENALELCASMPEQNINLLITDVAMPGMTGYQLAQKLLTARPNLKVLFVTGFIDPAHWSDFNSVPSDRILEKPFSPGELLGTVRRLLNDLKDE